MIISAGNMETFPFATPIGVGLVESAINLTRIVLYQNPKYLIFIGSAGSYGEYNIGDIVESSAASNIELSFFDNNSYTPINNVIDIKNQDFISSKTIVNCSNYITNTVKYNENMISNGIGIENMEFYSVLSVAKEFNINAGGIFVVSNNVGENAHNEFITNHKSSMQKLVGYLEEKNYIN